MSSPSSFLFTLVFYGSKPSCNCGGIRRGALLARDDGPSIKLKDKDLLDEKKEYKELEMVKFSDRDGIVANIFKSKATNLKVELTKDSINIIQDNKIIFNIILSQPLLMLSATYTLAIYG